MRNVFFFLSIVCIGCVFSSCTTNGGGSHSSDSLPETAPADAPSTVNNSPTLTDQTSPEPTAGGTSQVSIDASASAADASPLDATPNGAALEAQPQTAHSPKVPYAQAVLESYAAAYPHKQLNVFCKDGEWGITNGKTDFWWANGKLLPYELLSKQSEYGEQVIYAYTAKPRDPTTYTKTHIAELRKKGTAAAIAAEKPVDDTFLCMLLDTKTRVKTESHIKKTQLFGKRVNIHELLVPLFAAVDAEVTALSKTDAEVAHFLTTIYEVGGYNWRTIDGTNGRRSNHSYGIAVDITIKNNKKITYWEWERVWNKDWMLVPQKRLWAPPESVIKAFEKRGFVWGGTWDEYDTMHFEWRPELHELNTRITAME